MRDRSSVPTRASRITGDVAAVRRSGGERAVPRQAHRVAHGNGPSWVVAGWRVRVQSIGGNGSMRSYMLGSLGGLGFIVAFGCSSTPSTADGSSEHILFVAHDGV